MSACVIGHITVKDAEKWAQYRAQVPATLAPWGAEVLFRGKTAATLAGRHPHTDTVVIRFPDTNAVERLVRVQHLPGPDPVARSGRRGRAGQLYRVNSSR